MYLAAAEKQPSYIATYTHLCACQTRKQPTKAGEAGEPENDKKLSEMWADVSLLFSKFEYFMV